VRVTAAALRSEFLLDPDVAFLNHGSFGACPRSVHEAYRRWQLELERNPVEFLARRADALIAGAREELAAAVGASPERLVFVTNASTGVNVVASSLDLRRGDEVLATDHEYGACDLAWERACARAGACYRRVPLPTPLRSPDEVVERLDAAAGPRTRAVFVSHVTSATALVMPVAAICRRFRERGVLSIVDGAHAPGQLELALDELGADLYAGNCHKWLCSPKGAGFLYADPAHHEWVGSAIVSWGWMPGHSFQSRNAWQGTRDPAAYLAVPDALRFHRERLAPRAASARRLALQARRRLAELTGLEQICAEDGFLAQMAAAPLPPCDPERVCERLARERIEVPAWRWSETPLLRVSCAAYTTEEEVERLLEALPRALAGR
jgi:isopenicillin-N epimerase